MSELARAAAEVSKAMRQVPRTNASRARLALLAAEVSQTLRNHTAKVDRDAEWQRVHSYIADVLKDTHVLYAKLARLEGDFVGEELTRLERISEAVLTLGNELSAFSKAFYEGKYDMAQNEFAYGEGGGGGGESPAPEVEEEALIVPEPSGEEEAVEAVEAQGQGGEQAEEAQ